MFWSKWKPVTHTTLRHAVLFGTTLFVEHDRTAERPYRVYNKTNIGSWPMGSFLTAHEAKAEAQSLWS